jgi:ribosomal protein L44E
MKPVRHFCPACTELEYAKIASMTKRKYQTMNRNGTQAAKVFEEE